MSGIENFDLVGFAFGTFNLLRLGSYLPQIISVARDQHGASAISFVAWSVWVGANASTAVYLWDRMGDLAAVLINSFNALCCLIVLAITAWKRVTHAARAQSMAHAS